MAVRTLGLVIILVGAFALTSLVLNKTKMKKPVDGRITSPFGNRVHPITGGVKFHNGIDIAAAVGTPVISPSSGIVLKSYYNSTGGNQIVIEHDNGYKSGFAHLEHKRVDVGMRVKSGQEIGTVGLTGKITGPHLHYTLRNKLGEYVDPQTILK